MSSREKRLLFLFLTAIFVVANVALVKLGQAWRKDLDRKIEADRITLEMADFAAAERDAVADELDWLERFPPPEKEAELVPSELQSMVQNAAMQNGLTVNRPKILDSVEGAFFDRARFEILVSGQEAALWRWLVQLQSPTGYRAVTMLRLSPNRENETLIDATVEVEQWYVPKGAAGESETASTAAIEP